MNAHPYLTNLYREARRDWAENPSIRRAAHELGITEREYCDRRVAEHGPFTFTTSDTNPIIWSQEDAFREAAIV